MPSARSVYLLFFIEPLCYNKQNNMLLGGIFLKKSHKVTVLILVCALIFSLPGCSSHKPRTGEASIAEASMIVEASIAEASMIAEGSMTVEASISGEESMTAEEFQEIMEGEEFVLTEGPSSEYISDMFGVAVNECILVTQGDITNPDAWVIYTILGSSEDAIKYFDGMVDASENSIANADLDVTTTLENSDNNSKWTGKGDSGTGFNAYQVLIRLGNTTLAVTTKYKLESDIETADAIVSKLGY